MDLHDIASALAAHCRKGDWASAHKELYAPDAVSIEQEASPVFAKETRGLEAISQKGKVFDGMLDAIHSITVSDPLVAGDCFAFTLTMDLTMKGRGRMTMTEICVYEVKDGKIISEQFFN